MRVSALLPFLFAACAIASPSPRTTTHVVHERRAAEPLDWTQDRRLDADRILPMRFGLAQQNMHRLEELLLEVSHPESPKYGQHYTPSQVVDMFSPSADTIAAVTGWLTEFGFSSERLRLAPNKAWIHLNATTAEVEELLQTEYHVFTHPSGDEQLGKYLIHTCVINVVFIAFVFLRMPRLLHPRPHQRSYRAY
jgi:tripeptidyl-peptidase-1